jgi:hypothetical protein
VLTRLCDRLYPAYFAARDARAASGARAARVGAA